VFALVEGRVAHLAQLLGVATQTGDVAHGDLVRCGAEMLAAQRREACQDDVEPLLAGDESGKGHAVV
jgi:hypothetical protein